MLTLSFCVAFSWFWSLDCATHPWWFSSSDLFFAIKYTLIKSFHLLNRIDFVPFFVMDFHNFTTTTKYCRESFHRFTAILLFSLRRKKKEFYRFIEHLCSRTILIILLKIRFVFFVTVLSHTRTLDIYQVNETFVMWPSGDNIVSYTTILYIATQCTHSP